MTHEVQTARDRGPSLLSASPPVVRKKTFQSPFSSLKWLNLFWGMVTSIQGYRQAGHVTTVMGVAIKRYG